MSRRRLITVTCPACGSPIVNDARFCSACGQELTRRADERRVVTVLFADIVGFTGLSEYKDPEQVKNFVDRCFALLADDITAFGGRVDKVVGDAIVALFGAPIAHEDDAERAVRAALRMQETVTRFDDETGVGIRLRIGINTGEVLVGAMQAGDDYTAMGDVVNTASRLQTTAEPGTVVVGADTYTATQELIRYRSVGQLHARGREVPVTAYRALAPYGRPGERRTSPELPFVGRERELSTSRVAMEQAYGDRRGLLMAITGEPGQGKTRLAAELAELARFDHDAIVLHGRCLPYGETNIWWPIAELVRSATGLDIDATYDTARKTIDDMVTSVLRERSAALDAGRVADGILHLLGYETSLAKLAAERASAEVTRSTRIILGVLTRRSPLLLWLSDLHWADDEVLRLLDDLLDRLGRRPVVVLVSGTAVLHERWTPRSSLFNSLSLVLDGLDDVSMKLLAAEVAPDLDVSTRLALVERAGGNPLFLEEMARMVAATGSGAAEAGSLPANVRSVIGARLDALDEPARNLIGDAAVLGLRGERKSLQRMTSFTQGESDIQDAIITLQRADLLNVTTNAWAFRSNVVRDVVYDRLTKTQRAFRHGGVARWIETHRPSDVDTIARHYRQAAALVDEIGGIEGSDVDLADKAVEWTIKALDELSVRSSNDQMIELQTTSLDLLPSDDARRVDVLLRRSETWARSLELTAARADLDEARSLIDGTTPIETKARCELAASELAQWADDYGPAVQHAQVALDLAVESGNDPLRAAALRRRGMAEVFQGTTAAAEESISASFTVYERLGDEVGMAWARQNLAWISFSEGRMGEAEDRLHIAADAFERAGDLAGQAWSTGLLAYVRIYDGRFAEADELARTALLDAREQGDKWGQGMMNVALATSALWSGRVDDALEHSEAAVTHFPEGADSLGVAQALAVRGRALVRRGRLDLGFQLLENASRDHTVGPGADLLQTATIAAAATVGDVARFEGFEALVSNDPEVLGEAERRVTRAVAYLQTGDPHNAVDLLAQSPPPGSENESVWAWAAMAIGRTALDLPIDEFVDAVEASSRATYSDRVIARIAVALAAARADDSAAAEAALERARAALPSGGDMLFPAIIDIAAAVVATRSGSNDAASLRAATIEALTTMGIPESGWWTAFEAAVGARRVGA